ncbi:hypothetical protein QTP88_014606 [Uroleucon formosanum]
MSGFARALIIVSQIIPASEKGNLAFRIVQGAVVLYRFAKKSMICKIGVPFRVPVIVAPANRSSMKRRTIYFNHAMIRRFSFTMAVFVPLVSFMISYAAGFN